LLISVFIHRFDDAIVFQHKMTLLEKFESKVMLYSLSALNLILIKNVKLKVPVNL